MRRRDTPYSRLAEIRASRGELWILVLVTLLLGLAVNVAGAALYEVVCARGLPCVWSLGISLAAALLLTMIVVWRLYSRAESAPAQIELWLPYHLPGGDGRTPPAVTIARRSSYQVTQYARRAWMRRYPKGAPQTRDWLARWQKARAAGIPFQQFVLDDHVALSQCLLLYALHRAGGEILGDEGGFGWWAVDLPAQPWRIDNLPPSLRDNPFLRADQRADEWRLLLPRDVSLTLTSQPGHPWPRWTLRHRRYGQIDLIWKARVAVAGRGHQVWRVLTQRLHLGQRSELYILNARLEARARFRRTLLPWSDPFHQWAAGLLARLEEALDWGYFLETRPARVLADLDWKLGWWEEGDSLADALARLERRLDGLALSSLDDRPIEDMEEPLEGNSQPEGGLETRPTGGNDG